jgi:Tfp pilus assembly pilus retraction ATPase PilT
MIKVFLLFKAEYESLSLGIAFELFVEILQMQTARRFLILDYLSSKLSNDVSIEILWRNAIVCYDQSSSPYVQTCLINAYLDSIKAGLAFEIIDGDNFYLPHRFLAKTFTSFNEKNQHRILILSILGPRQSGKSTLLQYMFGIRINKRSTRGFIVIQK